MPHQTDKNLVVRPGMKAMPHRTDKLVVLPAMKAIRRRTYYLVLLPAPRAVPGQSGIMIITRRTVITRQTVNLVVLGQPASLQVPSQTDNPPQTDLSDPSNPATNRSADQLEADILAEIAAFSEATSGASRGQPRGRGRGTRGSRGSRGGSGRGRGGKSSAASRQKNPTNLNPDPNQQSTTSKDVNLQNTDDMLEDEEDEGEPPSKHQRKKLEQNILEELQKLPFDQLRQRAVKYSHYQRLTAEDRIALYEAYMAYQREVYLLICERRLQVKPALDHLGLLTRIRGATNFNQYCLYDEVASLTFHNESIHPNERMKICGLLWGGVDDETKKKWKDADFVQTKRLAFSQTSTANVPNETVTAPSLKKSRFKLNEWAQIMKSDLRNLSTAHHLEGFLVLVPRDPDSNLLITGGSLLGEQFINMMAKKQPNPLRSFFSFVSGQVAFKEITGVEPPPPVIEKPKKRTIVFEDELEKSYDKGSKPKNLEAVREHLANAIYDVTHGELQQWPGSKTVATLKRYDVELRVKHNYKTITPEYFCARPADMKEIRLVRILVALGEGWVKLIGPPAPDLEVGGCTSIGGNNSSDNNPNNNDTTGSGSGTLDSGRTVVLVGQRSQSATKGRTHMSRVGVKRKRPSDPRKKNPINRKNQKNTSSAEKSNSDGHRKRRRLVISDDSDDNAADHEHE
ncbi:hypothetical protein PGTUg99_030369 [Puccinia graminis f. sp. tritici]|uniref:Uncharacterized protein n=1 Tax=Puccinia graminis f. sp. tritici TaxID=56615 RepID=A0A5B0SKI7_PUCGR|nr:hypothetical protein PGTUg99_030369 [Puccinia graminis f. sp. tritici]